MSLPLGADPQEPTAPARAHHRVMSLASKPAPVRDPLSFHRSADPARSRLQGGLLTGSRPPLGIHLLWARDAPWAAAVKACSVKQLTLTPGSPLPMLLHRPWCLQSCSLQILTPLFQMLMHSRFFFFPFLKMFSCNPSVWGAWPRPSWSSWPWAMGEVSNSFSQKPLLLPNPGQANPKHSQNLI